ncbi:MAG: hypothetical protein IJA87_09950 [Clostridia bacterium]|nr:hypothetical protein [Clostridia bacterium]
MKTKFRRLLAVIMVMIIFASPLSASMIHSDSNVSSANPPDDYEIIFEESNDFSIGVMSEVSNAENDILLIQDNLPWDSNANETVLRRIGANYDKISSSKLSSIDLGSYKVAIIANDQSVSSYANYKSIREQLDYFVNIGGVLIFGAADNGWAKGSFDWELPGGVRKQNKNAYNNYIFDFDNPIVTGELSDGLSLSDSDLSSNYCSHTVFIEDTLPANHNVILRSSSDNSPTLVEYPVGNGYVIASGLTWEHAYVYDYGEFSRKAMDDLFLYAIEKSNSDRNIEKMQIFEDNSSFENCSSDFFKDSEKHKYLISDSYFNKLSTYYENTWFENIISTIGIKNQLQKARESQWGGSCHGISVSMALSHIGEIDINNFDDYAENYFDFSKPKDNNRLRDLINYYQLSQYLQIIDAGSISVSVSNNDELKKELKTIVELAQESEKSGYPFLFSFGWNFGFLLPKDTAGHTIVCVGVKEKDGYFRLQFVDPNSFNAYIYARVSKDYDSIVFEDKYNSNEYYSFKLTWIGHEFLSNYSKIDIDGADNSLVLNSQILSNGFIDDTYNVDIIVFNSNSSFEIISSNGAFLRFDDAELTGDMEILEVSYCNKGDSVDYQVMVNSNSQYEITPISEYIDLSIYNTQGAYTAFVGKNAEEISIDLNSGVEVIGSSMDYQAYYGMSGENTQMISITATDSNHIKMDEKQEYIQVNGDNLYDCEVNGYYESLVYPIVVDNSESFIINKDNEIEYEISFVYPDVDTLNYGDILVLQIDRTVLPLNSKLVWYSESDGVTIQEFGNGEMCYVTSDKSGDVSITIKAVHENGEPALDVDGNEIYSEITLKSNAGFFWRIISFFKNLFGIDRYVY